MGYEDLKLIKLRFKVLKHIDKLPHFHGKHWYAMFCEMIRSHLQKDKGSKTEGLLSENRITIIDPNIGLNYFEPGNIIEIGLNFPYDLSVNLETAFNNIYKNNYTGHFIPGKSIELLNIVDRITGEEWKSDNKVSLSELIIKKEIKKVLSLKKLTITFYSPFRALRPKGHKESNRVLMDEPFFKNNDNQPIIHFLSKIREVDVEKEINGNYIINNIGFKFIDGYYSMGNKGDVGGVVGSLEIEGDFEKDFVLNLVLGQYTGAGKSGSLGFGFYYICNLDDVRIIKKVNRETHYFNRYFNINYISKTLKSFSDYSSPGTDGLSHCDIKEMQDQNIENIIDEIKDDRYEFEKFKTYKIPKDNNKWREIIVFNVKDKIVNRLINDALYTPIDYLLSNSSYAYRKGNNTKNAVKELRKYMDSGYDFGFKADISDFFGTIDTKRLRLIISGLFYQDKIIEILFRWFDYLEKYSVKGLPQGASISPLLSNLYLDDFDKIIWDKELRIIRFADDFIILANKNNKKTAEQLIAETDFLLQSFGLKINPEKTELIVENKPIKFLGKIISKEMVYEDKKEEIIQWTELFTHNWIRGYPLYITSLNKGVYTDGNNIIIGYYDAMKKNDRVPWKTVSKAVIVGKSSYSSGFINRAIRENIPVFFVDVTGILRGALYNESREIEDLSNWQENFFKDDKERIIFARDIINAKINNSYYNLKRFGIDNMEIKEIEEKINKSEYLDEIRGYEGYAAKLYFDEFKSLVKPLKFERRIYHPPDNEVNAMLSFGYTLLYNRISLSLRSNGINNRLGIFHQRRGRHAALASDIMEELRYIIDNIVIELIKTNGVTSSDFTYSNQPDIKFCRLSGYGFRAFIRKFENTMSEKIVYKNEKISLNSYIDEMSLKVKRLLKLNITYKARRIEESDLDSSL